MKHTTTLILVITCFISLLSFKSIAQDTRINTNLNQLDWKFKRSDIKNAQKEKFNDSEWLSVKLPHDFNGGSDGVHNDVFDGRFNFGEDPDERKMYKGIAWYRTKFSISENLKGKKVFIKFEAVSLVADIYINGKNVGIHKGGYTAFEFDITEFINVGKENTLAVKVDNSNNKTIAPWMADEKNSFPYSFDYAIYGGIYRDVWLTITNDVKIEKVFNTPVIGGQAPAVLTIDTRVKNYNKVPQDVVLKSKIIDPAGNEVSTLTRKKQIAAGETVSLKQSESSLGNVEYWSPEKPNVYKVESTLSINNEVVDYFESNFGFRYFSFANKQPFILNNTPTFIKGVNRHQDMEGLGYALSNEQHHLDAQIIKDAGFNFVRHAHYPCDVEFGKACRDLGLMLWLEIPLTGSTSDDPLFLENCKSQLTEMIEQNYNNPAVIIWGIGNESDRSGGSEAVSNKVFAELAKLCRELDPNRPSTGCNYKYQSNKDIVDAYSPQDWTGWYHGSVSEYNPTHVIGEYGTSIEFTMRDSTQFDIKKDYHAAGKPSFWSQEYGAFIHEYKVSKGIEKQNEFPGHFAWVAFDFASPRLGRNTNPIPYMNQKGLLLHDHKTKKDIYFFYQSMYRTAEDYPLVYIVPSTWTTDSNEESPVSIWSYSNCDSVLLYNNGELIGSRTKTAGPRGDTRFQWNDVKIKKGDIYAEGWFNSKLVAKDTVQVK